MLQIGSLVDNKYKILSEVGHGGMSVVYLAINERANKTWAVKEVRKDGVCDFEAVKQGLVVETDMLKKLNHQFLPSIIDVIDSVDSFLIVMDYIEGKSLQKVLKNGGAQPQDLVIKWGIQLCDVLGYLHSREPAIIYRDMKPSNVMLKPNGDITLIDFGTAREFKNRAMVEDTTCLGTRGYAAPEQFGGRGQTDPRTDIYCLGATLYHLITGHSPAEPPYEIKPLSYWDPKYFESGIEQIIAKCCQQDPAQRYQSCAELMYDLENVSTLDMSVQRKRNQKWKAFLASGIMCGVGVLGIVASSIGHAASVRESYDYYIDQAQTSGNFNGMTENINYALKIDPGRYDAYDLLLSSIEQDGELDKNTEWSALYAAMNNGSNATDTNISHLLRDNRENYADIMYRVGKLRFLMSENTDADLKEAVVYFNKALKDGQMETSDDPEIQQRVKIAQSLVTIGSSIDKLGTSMFNDNTGDYTYGTLFNDLKQLITDYQVDGLGPKQYGIALYNRVAFMISKYYLDMQSTGISKQDMLNVLQTIETRLDAAYQGLSDSEKNLGLDELINGACNNIVSARNTINAMSTGGIN